MSILLKAEYRVCLRLINVLTRSVSVREIGKTGKKLVFGKIETAGSISLRRLATFRSFVHIIKKNDPHFEHVEDVDHE